MSDELYFKYECVICGFIYDEALGIPEDGIVPGTRWADLPDAWECPDCGISKSDFDLIEE
ncbi:rubredoxin [Kineobactrum sediminis]|uniref:Rubredoxin n=1 Tax=Kineobactrum sediminis TaxID=1905677 RepID=A0A2N5Y0L3_9GAMM|nr:rubredoxin [Kineobactrum sediminis]PLW81937.1 rubredoxin [Kineobactrum sediminis]